MVFCLVKFDCKSLAVGLSLTTYLQNTPFLLYPTCLYSKFSTAVLLLLLVIAFLELKMLLLFSPLDHTFPSCFLQHFWPMQLLLLVSHPNQLSLGGGQIYYHLSIQGVSVLPICWAWGPFSIQKMSKLMSHPPSFKQPIQHGFGGGNSSLIPLPFIAP